jgi:hypothetical protein
MLVSLVPTTVRIVRIMMNNDARSEQGQVIEQISFLLSFFDLRHQW